MRINFRVGGGWVLAVVMGMLLMGGCSKEGKWEGTYVNSKDKSELELKSEHKGTLKVGAVSTSELSWEIKGDDKIVVNVPYPIEMFKISGGLRDQEGTEWKRK